jgi:energy-coupling factor transporter ATP-binding protein EcfA2
MDANTLATFGIVGLVVLVFSYDRVKALFRGDAPTEAAPITEATIAEATEAAPLAFARVAQYVNDQPQNVPQLAVIGPSGAGKTTLVVALLHQRPGQIVILTGKEGDYWGGLPTIGIDDDLTYTRLGAMVEALTLEIRRRQLAAKQSRLTADWLTIVIDDYSTLRLECERLAGIVKIAARIGRSLRVRLIMLSDSMLVKSWGLEGEGESRSNFAVIRLKRGHTGAIEIEEQWIPIDYAPACAYERRPFPAARAWQPPREQAIELNEWLGLSASDGAFSGYSDQTRPSRPDRLDQTEPSNRVLMRKYRSSGVKREIAQNLLRADGLSFDNNFWAELGKEQEE